MPRIATGSATVTLDPPTIDGAIVGTVAYMSPEQAQGLPVDARSDSCSFGSVLCEMMTGQRAFAGANSVSTLTAIVRSEPAVAPLPGGVERILRRCLRKDPNERYQSIAEVITELERLIGEAGSRHLIDRLRRHSRSIAAAIVLVAVLMGVLWTRRAAPPGPPLKVSTITALPGLATTPAFSPDGKQVAFVWNGDRQDNWDIYVQLVGEATASRLTTNPAFDHSPAWSPDGLRVAFLRDTSAGTEVLTIPATGGSEQKLHLSRLSFDPHDDWQAFGLAWSPDGKFLMFADAESSGTGLFLLDTATLQTRRLTAPPQGAWDGASAFSPDGRSAAFLRGHDRPLCDVYIVRLTRTGEPIGEPRRITFDNVFIQGLDWTEESRRIVFSSTRGGVPALWAVAASGGEPERLSVGSGNALWPSVPRKGHRLAYGDHTYDSNLWRIAAPGGGASNSPSAGPTRLTRSPAADAFPAYSPDNRKIAWSSTHSGSHQIWVSNSDGSAPHQLTYFDGAGAAEPHWSPDSGHIAFNGYNLGAHHVYIIGADGGAVRPLTSGDFDESVWSWSRDGNWVYFSSNRGGGGLWKALVRGGPAVLVARNSCCASESRDGKFVYYDGLEGAWKAPSGRGSPVLVARDGCCAVESFDGKLVYYDGPGGIWKVPVEGGEPVLFKNAGRRHEFTLSPSGIYVLDADASGGPALEYVPFSGKRIEAVKLPGKPDDYMMPPFGFGLSPDGRWIVYVRLDRNEENVMLVENFR